MTKTRLTAAGVLAVAGLTAGLACSSSSSTTGTLNLTGGQTLTAAQAAQNNFVPTVSLTASGAFSDTGHLTLKQGSGANGNGPGHGTVVLSKGNLDVTHGSSSPANPQPHLVSGCTFVVTQTTPYTITGGTGSYSGATGSGTATVTFDFTVPKLANGQCNTSNNVVPTGGSVKFSATGPVSVP